LNKKPFAFASIKYHPRNVNSNNNVNKEFISYNYDQLSLDEKCMRSSFNYLNKPAGVNLGYCASYNLNENWAKFPQLNDQCKAPIFQSAFLNSNNKTYNTNDYNNTNNSNNTNNNNIAIENFLGEDDEDEEEKNNKDNKGSKNNSITLTSIMFNLDTKNKSIPFVPYFYDYKNYLVGKPLFVDFSNKLQLLYTLFEKKIISNRSFGTFLFKSGLC
jgi:hypothetical protein